MTQRRSACAPPRAASRPAIGLKHNGTRDRAAEPGALAEAHVRRAYTIFHAPGARFLWGWNEAQAEEENAITRAGVGKRYELARPGFPHTDAQTARLAAGRTATLTAYALKHHAPSLAHLKAFAQTSRTIRPTGP